MFENRSVHAVSRMVKKRLEFDLDTSFKVTERLRMLENALSASYYFIFKLTQNKPHDPKGPENIQSGPEVIKLFFMINSIEHEIFPAHKC